MPQIRRPIIRKCGEIKAIWALLVSAQFLRLFGICARLTGGVVCGGVSANAPRDPTKFKYKDKHRVEKYKPRDQCKRNKLAVMPLCGDSPPSDYHMRVSERRPITPQLEQPALGYWFLIHSSRTRSTLTYLFHPLFADCGAALLSFLSALKSNIRWHGEISS